jgi:flagellin-like hook-associated protein FlgL
MANIGLANASYYAGTSITRFNNQVETSVEKVASNKAHVSNGDKTALVNMNSNFKLEIAATNAAVKSMSIAQAYLSTAISTLDNSSAILTKIHELAVLSANGSNSDADNEALNTESEALIDAFHKSMTVAQFKGKQVFTDEPGTLSIAAGGQASQIQFGVGKVDYDVLYDYENPGLTSLSAGVKYEIRRELNELEKAAILSRTTDLTAEQLVKGFQFTTDDVPTENIGDGTINVNPNGTNIHTYNQGSGVQQFDATASAAGITADFKDGFLEFEITENYELSDNLSVQSTGNITVTDGVVFYTDNNLVDENGAPAAPQTIEIGVVDEVKNGQNGTTLRINLHHDATVPGSSDLDNGDFSQVRRDIGSYTTLYHDAVAETEFRAGNLTSLDVGVAPADPGYTVTRQNLALVNDPQEGGIGENGRISATISDGVVHAITILDGGNGYAVGDVLTFSTDVDDDGVDETFSTVVTGTQDAIVTVTEARTREVGTGEFELREVQVPGDIIGFEEDTVNPDTGVVTPGDPIRGPDKTELRNVEITVSVYDGEDTQYLPREIRGYSPNFVDRVADWTTFEGRVYFGSDFEILDSLDGTLVQTDPATGTVTPAADSYRRTVVPTPELDQMAIPAYEPFVSQFDPNVTATPTENVKNKDNLGAVANGFDVSLSGGRLELDTGALTFAEGYSILHGPAAVSDKFEAKQGQFLKLDYAAEKLPTGDDYHVAGYIYEVDDNGDPIRDNGLARITMAFSDTGTDGSGRASVEVERTANYRFVFIGGTFDKTGLLESGARMFIDNIVAENPYTIGNGAISDLLKAVHFENDANSANPNKTLAVKAMTADGATMLTDDAIIKMENFSATLETNGPYMLAPTLDFTTQPSEGGSNSANVLTRKIETVQDRINLARTQAASQFSAVQEAIDSTTDLRSQFALASGTLSDLNFSVETVNLTRRQMQQDVASSVLVQANEAQTGLVSLVDGSYKTYLNSQF